ncbi:MAG: hypothetical protein K0R28_1100, partial [Paenibacillus sp.]|nr:hypothetical protein [Paenibacillus sp.]
SRKKWSRKRRKSHPRRKPAAIRLPRLRLRHPRPIRPARNRQAERATGLRQEIKPVRPIPDRTPLATEVPPAAAERVRRPGAPNRTPLPEQRAVRPRHPQVREQEPRLPARTEVRAVRQTARRRRPATEQQQEQTYLLREPAALTLPAVLQQARAGHLQQTEPEPGNRQRHPLRQQAVRLAALREAAVRQAQPAHLALRVLERQVLRHQPQPALRLHPVHQLQPVQPPVQPFHPVRQLQPVRLSQPAQRPPLQAQPERQHLHNNIHNRYCKPFRS